MKRRGDNHKEGEDKGGAQTMFYETENSNMECSRVLEG